MQTRRWRSPFFPLLLAALLAVMTGLARVGAQSYDKIQRERARSMLEQVHQGLKSKYYDPTFHGLDIDEHFRLAQERLDGVQTYDQALAVIAQAVTDLDDSHTYFDPPSRSSAVDYGWRHRMVGETCLVTGVRPGSDAAAKGLKPGDTILKMEDFVARRADLWKLDYLFYILNRRATIRIVAQSPGGEPRTLDINAQIRQFRRTLDLTTVEGISDVLAELDNGPKLHRFRENDGIVIWKMGSFDLLPADVDEYMNKRVRRAKALILDLRGNGGGYVETLERLVSHFFDREIRIAELQGRRKMKPIVASKRRGKPFEGQVIVLVDSDSGSASEIFARVMQLEKRGRVIGDRSAGAVMQAESMTGKLSAGSDSVIVFTLNITNADVIMSDGQSLEHRGVTPDDLVLPSAQDYAAGRDPVLMKAIQLVGGRISPEGSGKLFPMEWRQ